MRVTAAARRKVGAMRDLVQRWRRHRAGDVYSSYVLAERAAHLFLPSYRFSEYGLRWHEDPGFSSYYRQFVLDPIGPENWHSADRKYFMRSLLQLIAELPGDMAECGVYRGATARLMALAGGPERTLHLFDSFEGLSQPSEGDGTHWRAHDLSVSSNPVREALADVSTPYQLYEGWIPDRFAEVADRRFSFVHIDVDLYQPTADSLAFFYPLVVPGGVILLDDYGFTTCPGAARAADEWARSVPEPLIEVPTGQVFVIKR